ncbi:hypothetical protein BAZSYMB_GCONTIG00706_0 [Bathymodiolus azoricus thioautotrophic gill symbiont]|jgi:hypothetical protein|uniref:DNA (cytosine-5-)-methyltransferase n=1 Tax=Bathymodiolus azoricus thioautotrophic gill symbiont TaxID=235205 RepID=A0A1H6M3H8_9GAMM|nr:hypothetical protein BAZSYMB_GCONTIG00706_0 [Bathymodiolus azoricus thioautotrophic gill symbiont]
MAGYKMVGNAVPCNLAYCLGKSLKQQLIEYQAHNKKITPFPVAKDHAISVCR